jgi:two-component system, LytTR family, sensor kinase
MHINRSHIYYWLIYYSVVFLLDYTAYGSLLRVDRELLVFFMQLCVFYSFLFSLLHFRGGDFLSWLKSASLFSLSFGLVIFFNYLRSRLAAHYGIDLHGGSPSVFLTETIAIYSQFSFYALGYYYLTRSNQKQNELRQLAEAKAAQEAANAQLRQNLLEAENSFLRAQINPHFLYNTLNVFYAQALPLSKPLANNIVVLADIMRYSLEATESNTLVPLRMEVDQLERVVALHQLRFGGNLHIALTVNAQTDGINVAPLIFVTLLENALKHGELNDPTAPVAIWLATSNAQIFFTIRNKKSTDPPEHGHGIGLDNIRKRLDNIYGDNYRLGINDSVDWFEAVLTIKYNPMAMADG